MGTGGNKVSKFREIEQTQVKFEQYFQVSYVNFKLGFPQLVISKSYDRSLQYNVNNLGAKFLSTFYSNFLWILSSYFFSGRGVCLEFLLK